MKRSFRNLTRREFVRQMVLGSLSVPVLIEGLAENLGAEESDYRQSIIWLQGQSSGIHRSGIWSLPEFAGFLKNHFKVMSVDQLDLNDFSIDFSEERPPHILLLDGYFIDDPDDRLHNLLKDLIVVSRAVVLLGNEAAYSSTSPDGFMDLETGLLHQVETPFYKLPGAPVPARHLLGILNHLMLYDLPEIDEYRRPLMFHSNRICDRCEYRGDFEAGRFVGHFGDKEGCLFRLGCKGPVTKNSCPVEKWNGTSNWCVGAGSPCTGCSEPDHPDHRGLGMYGQLASETASVNSFFIRNSEVIGTGALAVTATGIALHALSKKTSTPLQSKKMLIIEDEEE
ncbi:MAG: hypothetical protein GY866_22650 [Proteobacteria bacterium]|nr:hypothetical protein [Pseudomonadota bacterium]